MGTVKWLTIVVLLGSCFQVSAATDMGAYVFTATSKSITVIWESQTGATSYKLTATDQATLPVTFAVFNSNVVMGTVNMLTPGTEYQLQVEALDDGGAVLASQTIAETTAPEVMAAISSVVSKDSTTLEVDFTLSASATHYIVRIQGSGGFFREDEVISSPAEILSLSPYTTYSLRIMAVNKGGRSQPSPPVTAKTVLPPPELTTSSATNDTIDVSWDAIDDAISYNITINESETTVYMNYTTNETSITLSGLDPGRLYVIVCYATDAEERQGESSSTINQVTRPPTPTYVSVSSSVNSEGVTELTVSWVLDPNVWGEINGTVTNEVLNCSSITGTCVLSPVGCGEQHEIQVTVSNDAGSSAPTEAEVFTAFPCPPGSLAYSDQGSGSCELTWAAVDHALGYIAHVNRSDFTTQECNVTDVSCDFTCECGYTYLMSVFAYNDAGWSETGESLNFTTLSCCPNDTVTSMLTMDTLKVNWTATRGAVLYQTTATLHSDVIECNDTASECVLSDLTCDKTYNVVVTPCNDISGCNTECQSYNIYTAPCMVPDIVLTEIDATTYTVQWMTSNNVANYNATAVGDEDTIFCTSLISSCNLENLSCGTVYEITVTANFMGAQSLPSYSEFLETEPCCPETLNVTQVTQSMSEISWSEAKGASTFVTSLTSTNGEARCHTENSQCTVGCITCGSTYTVEMEVLSRSGLSKHCTYEGFSSSACCPTYVRLYRTDDVNTLHVYWRNSDSEHKHFAELLNTTYNCTAEAGTSSCNIANIQCGETYHLVVSPLKEDDSKSLFCPERLYAVSCLENNIRNVLYRGKRSVD